MTICFKRIKKETLTEHTPVIAPDLNLKCHNKILKFPDLFLIVVKWFILI